MPSRWYRSRLFWAGLAGLAMLLWMCLAFPDREARFCWVRPKCVLSLDCGNRQLTIGIIGDKGYGGFGDNSLSFHHEPLQPWEAGRSNAAWHVERYEDMLLYETKIIFAGWLILLVYLVLWSAALVWWQRRKHRLTPSGGSGLTDVRELP